MGGVVPLDNQEAGSSCTFSNFQVTNSYLPFFPKKGLGKRNIRWQVCQRVSEPEVRVCGLITFEEPKSLGPLKRLQ